MSVPEGEITEILKPETTDELQQEPMSRSLQLP